MSIQPLTSQSIVMYKYVSCRVKDCLESSSHHKADGLCLMHYTAFRDTNYARVAIEHRWTKPPSLITLYDSPEWHIAIDQWLETL
jgi:hypothetical protein